MLWFILLIHLFLMTTLHAINRPVYKIVLTQKGYAQFLQYDVETPPLREFTFCTWIRVYDLTDDQTIFTYIVNSNSRIMRLWLDTGGRNIKLSINDRISTFPVEIMNDVWRHVCLSYQSDYGAWALYVDSRLAACESAQSLHGYVLPGGGSVLIGYGINDHGVSKGFEGEIFGVNMILASTIEKNYTNKKNPAFEQKMFPRNKIRETGKNMQYIILSDLQTDEIQNNYEKTKNMGNSTKNFIKIKTPHSFVEHNVGVDAVPTKIPAYNDPMAYDFTLPTTTRQGESDKFDYWNSLGSTENTKLKSQSIKNTHSTSITRILPTVSEYITPPSSRNPYFEIQDEKPTKFESIYKLKDSTPTKQKTISKSSAEISEIETPPPVSKDSNVYGQWTSSKYAGAVLNYLKSINFHRDHITRKVPPTISLGRHSDSYPYASELIINKLRPPPQFQRRNFVEKRYDIVKREPQINLQILEDDSRSNILKMHAQTQPKDVEVTNRGEGKKNTDHRFYRSANFYDSGDLNSIEDMFKPKPFTLSSSKKTKIRNFSGPNIPNQKYKSVLPFLRSLEYIINDSHKSDQQGTTKEEMYTKSLSQGNKWHNVKSYNNDYTPRKINMDPEDNKDVNMKRHPTIRLKYKPDERKVVEDEDPTITKGRKLAIEVSNPSETIKDTVSILKYNHGYLDDKDKHTEALDHISSKRRVNKNNFDKQVKIGNALNEHFFIGKDDYQKKKSFIGGHANIPDINRYRSDIDNENAGVPSSLGPRVCKNLELYDRFLYVQQDESIDMTHILSPVRAKNVAIEFIIQNYKKCSLAESKLESNPKLFIDWSKTPVRLFGGASPRTTTDLCGFF